MTTFFSLFLLVPVVKALLVTNLEFMVWEYALIFLVGALAIGLELGRCNSMKQAFIQAEVNLNRELTLIRDSFNRKS